MPQAELTITLNGFGFAVLHVRQVQHRSLRVEVRKCVIQRVKHPCEVTLVLRSQARWPSEPLIRQLLCSPLCPDLRTSAT